MLPILFYKETKKALLGAALLALPRAIYLLPYYYLYENAYGNDSLESITLSFFITLFGVLILFLHILLVMLLLGFISVRVANHGASKKKTSLTAKEKCAEARIKLEEEIAKKGFFDLSVPIVLAVFSVSLLEFLYPLINEIILTVNFFAKYGSSYTTGEIFSIAFAFIFVLAELISLHVLGILVKELSLKVKDKNHNGCEENP